MRCDDSNIVYISKELEKVIRCDDSNIVYISKELEKVINVFNKFYIY